jgi:RND superfamily putative drug exporter
VALVPFAAIAVVLYNHVSYDLVSELPANSPSVSATRMLQEHFPAGMVGPTTALLVVPDVDFGSTQGRTIIARITDEIRSRRDQLDVADIRSLTAPLGTRNTAKEAFANTDLPESVREKAIERAAMQNYTTSVGQRHRPGTRFDLVLKTKNPFSAQTAKDLGRIEDVIRQTLPAERQPEAQIYFLGTTASIRDLSEVLAQDRNRIEVLVLVSVLAVLLVLLRSVVVPLYLLASVFFSYCASLGVTYVVYWLLDPQGFQGLDWQVPIFLFTILIAVGEDYNIFLVARVREEQQRYGLVQGVAEGLVRTGPIISSCGIIMAGTFGSLLAGSLTGMRQLGFALAFGVLLDTFVVRPVLVPAFLVLLHSGRLQLWRWHTSEVPSRQPTAPIRPPSGRLARGARQDDPARRTKLSTPPPRSA